MNMELVCDTLSFPEGPIACRDGSIILTEIRAQRLTRIDAGGQWTVLAETGGGPNGAAVGPDGKIWITNNGGAFEWLDRRDLCFPGHTPKDHVGGYIQRFDPATGALDRVYEGCGGNALISPNDLVFDSHGGFWFTDMGAHDEHGHRNGGVYYATPDGCHISLQRGQLLSPNGIGLSPDEKTLYVADTLFARLWSFDIEAPGQLARPRGGVPGKVMCNLPGYNMFDSLAVEQDGRVCVATIVNGGITSVAPDGSYEHFPFPDAMCTNIAFGGPDMTTAWITASSTGKLFRAEWPRPGLRTSFEI